jgi:calcineurin-like phosphoesterase family protein
MGGVWFTADLHLGHKKVSDLRGFSNPQEHNDAIVARWRKMIRYEDEVWVLGDISGGGSASQLSALAILSKLPGTKYLVAGNHDSIHPMHGRKSTTWIPFYADVFKAVYTQMVLRSGGQKLFLSHFPRDKDHTPIARYPEWRPSIPYPYGGNENYWLLHGHTHSSENMGNHQEICVGLDAWDMKPVNIGVISQKILGYQQVK